MAIKSNRDKSKEYKRDGKILLGGAGAGMVATGGNLVFVNALVKGANKYKQGPVETHKMLKGLAKRDKIKLSVFHSMDNLQSLAQPWYLKKHLSKKKYNKMPAGVKSHIDNMYNNKKSIIITGGSEPVALHEYGHVKQYNQKVPRTMLRTDLYGRKPALILAAPLAFGGVRDKIKEKAHSKTIDKAMNFIEDNPYTTAMILSSNHLPSEFGASARASKEMIRRHGLSGGLKRTAPLVAAFGSYATSAALNGAVVGTGLKLLNHRRSEKRKEKEKIHKKAEMYADYIYKQAQKR